MTSPGDLLQAILADPANDDLRLVFADLLDDRGEGERAEFIRVQCELARLQAEEVARFNEETDWSQCTGIAASWCPNCGDCVCPFPEDERCSPNCPLHNRHSSHCCLEDIADKRERLREREAELFREYRVYRSFEEFGLRSQLWYADEGENIAIIRRGFVAEVRQSCQDWLTHGPALVRRQPIERVVMTDKTPGRMWGHDGGNESNYRRWWDALHSDTNRQMDADVLPGCLFRYIVFPFKSGYHFPTKSSALDALSEAALLWAKQTEPATSSA